jgi:hypothetical protein
MNEDERRDQKPFSFATLSMAATDGGLIRSGAASVEGTKTMIALISKKASAAAIAVLACASAVALPGVASAQSYGYDYPPAYGYGNGGYSQGTYYDPCARDQRQRATTGGLLGAAIGAVAGSQLAARGRRTEGSALGGVLGAAIGAGVGNSSAACDSNYRRDTRYSNSGYSGTYVRPPTATTIAAMMIAATATTTTGTIRKPSIRASAPRPAAIRAMATNAAWPKATSVFPTVAWRRAMSAPAVTNRAAIASSIKFQPPLSIDDVKRAARYPAALKSFELRLSAPRAETRRCRRRP